MPTHDPLAYRPRRGWRNRFAFFVLLAVGLLITLGLGGLLVVRLTNGWGMYSIGSNGMAPTLQRGDSVSMNGMAYHHAAPQRGDVVIFRTDEIPKLGLSSIFVQRVAGLPGEVLSLVDGVLLVNGQPAGLHNEEGDLTCVPHASCRYLLDPHDKITVPAECYFLLGDNSAHSLDSRAWGFVPAHAILGRANLRYRPPASFRRLR